MKKIKRNIVERLIAQTGLSIHAWSLQHGFAPTTLGAWLNGVRNIGGKNLLRLAEALGVEPEEICSVVFKADKVRIEESERMEQDLLGYFSGLTRAQKDRVVRMCEGLAGANRAEEELRHGIEYSEEK